MDTAPVQTLLERSSEYDEEIAQASEILVTFLSQDWPANYRPVLDRVLIYPISKPGGSMLKSGIITLHEEAPDHAVVLAVGPGAMLSSGVRVPMEVKVGDVVIYSKTSGAYVKKKDHGFLLIRQSDILAVRPGYDASRSS